MKHIAKATLLAVVTLVCFACKKTIEYKQSQTVLTDFTFPYKSYGDADFEIVPPTSNSPEPFTYTSSNTNVAEIVGTTIHIKNAGVTTITATQKASNEFTELAISTDFTVFTPRPTLSNFPAINKFTTDPEFTLNPPTSNSKGAFKYTITDPSVATITGNKVIVKKAGKTTITAEQTANGNYGLGIITAELTVNPAPVTGTMTDVDGNVYKTVKIGNQTWMMENLKVTHYQDGTAIPNVPAEQAWRTTTAGAYCSYQNLKANADTYGLLYNWYAVSNARKLAPQGWHVPTDADWQTLYAFLGSVRENGGKLRETGSAHWASDLGTNETGFTALGGGGRVFQNTGEFAYFNVYAYWWSASAKDGATANNIDFYEKGYFEFANKPKAFGLSVRCVKD